jgi:tetratricopeptide (TPR) repeat protein
LLQRYPGNSVAWYNRGIVLYQLKRVDDAVRSWTRTLELQPRESRALSNRAAALVLLKRHQEAAADYQRLVQLTPDNSAAWQNYAILLISSEQPDVRNTELALHAAEQACKLSEYEDWRHLNSLAKAHEAAGNLQQARTWAEKARAIAPSGFRAAPELLVRSLDARLKNQQNSAPSPVAGPNSSRRLRAATGGRPAVGN